MKIAFALSLLLSLLPAGWAEIPEPMTMKPEFFNSYRTEVPVKQLSSRWKPLPGGGFYDSETIDRSTEGWPTVSRTIRVWYKDVANAEPETLYLYCGRRYYDFKGHSGSIVPESSMENIFYALCGKK